MVAFSYNYPKLAREIVAQKEYEHRNFPANYARTLLHLAALRSGDDYAEIINELQRHDDTLVNLPDEKGMTPIELAVEIKNTKAVQALKKFPSIIVSKKALQCAIKNRDFETLIELLAGGGKFEVDKETYINLCQVKCRDNQDELKQKAIKLMQSRLRENGLI